MYTKEQKQVLRELIIYYTAKAETYKIVSCCPDLSSKVKKELVENAEKNSDFAYSIIRSLQNIGKSTSSSLNFLDCLDKIEQEKSN